MCMAMRGVEKNHASTVTTCFLGSFETNSELKSNFFSLLNVPSSSS
jgi:GTP cyclohydrolase I